MQNLLVERESPETEERFVFSGVSGHRFPPDCRIVNGHRQPPKGAITWSARASG